MTPPGWKCPKRIGFLFPHPCTRLTPEGCQDCQNGQIADPYIRRTDRYGYRSYDDYDDSLTGFALESLTEHIGHEHHFTEADGESMVLPQDGYEDDLSGS
jgi:hypothetical protein